MNDISSADEVGLASIARDYLALYRKNEDIINLGAYNKGVNARIDNAILAHERIMNLLKQNFMEHVSSRDSYEQLMEVVR